MPVGQVGTITVTVSRSVNLSLPLPGVPDARTLTSTAASVVHQYRQVARELFAAQDACTGERQMVILARAPGHDYLRDGGRGAHGLEIAFTDAESADFSIDRAGRKHVGTACRAGRVREGPVGRSKQRSPVSGGW
ncbi:hypothetical protein [Streptomyces sp. NPDC058086]|uniref:hypothetical protein n=1 Tax=Streptomyces sp. NPDC058086 TaxID=3346334 RepID=UPI0036E68B66